MRPFPTLVAVISVLSLSRIAAAGSAESPDTGYAEAHTGFQFGMRVSAQVPEGSLGSAGTLSSLMGPRMHVAFDIGSKVNPYFFVGGYVGVSYGLQGSGFSSVCSGSDASGDGSSCNAESVDGGLIAIVTFAPNRLVDPWAGLSLGYEVQGLNYAGATGTLTGISPTGLAGIDFRLRNREHKSFMSIGPYGGITAQKYVTARFDGSSLEPAGEPIHAWVHFGFRITFPS
jgi:hypothetical protein